MLDRVTQPTERRARGGRRAPDHGHRTHPPRMRPRTRKAVAAVARAGALLVVTGCGAADMTKQASPYANPRRQDRDLSVQSWVGAQANVAVAQYLLEHNSATASTCVQVDEVHLEAPQPGPRRRDHGGLGPPQEAQSGQEDHREQAATSASPDTSAGSSHVLRQTAPGRHGLEEPQQVRRQLKTAERRRGPTSSTAYVLRHQRQGLVQNLKLDYQVVFSGSRPPQITRSSSSPSRRSRS